MAQKLNCVVTGKSITVSDEYYQKKILDYKTEAQLKKLYVCRQAKNLLTRGYSFAEVQELLKITNGPRVDQSLIQEILLQTGDEHALDYTSTQKSEPAVAEYINNIKNL